jgi:hypothetical protein
MGSLSADAYRSPSTITGSNPSNFTETDPTAPPVNTMVNNNQLTQVYDPTDAAGDNLAQKTGFVATDPPPTAPNRMDLGRDPYKTQGMPSETYLDNSQDTPAAAPTVNGGPAVLLDE